MLMLYALPGRALPGHRSFVALRMTLGRDPASGRKDEAEEVQMDPRLRAAGMTEGRKMGMSDKGKIDSRQWLQGQALRPAGMTLWGKMSVIIRVNLQPDT